MTVAEMLSRISARELNEWVAFERLEPFGADAMFLGHAITASTIANAFRGEKQEPFMISEFMPPFKGKEPQSPSEQLQFAEMLTYGLGGKDLRKNKEGTP